MTKTLLLLTTLAMTSTSAFSGDVLDTLLNTYQVATQQDLTSERGAAFWQQENDQGLSCASCHGVDVTRPGKHVKTGKQIAPMAVSVNSDRLTDEAFIAKWLYRNCKAVWSRECTDQEKGDVLLWLSEQ